jgi:NAD+ synthase (glutamine-hydrolysing)
MRVAIAQLNQRVGDLAGNVRALCDSIAEARAAGAAVLVTPELSICGYPPEDLLLRSDFLDACASAVRDLAAQARDLVVLAGFPERADGRRYNAVAVLREGRVSAVHRKHCLPNATVFDEARTFTPGTEPCVFGVGGRRCGVLLCEDVWSPEPARQSRDAGADLLLVPNASPYHTRQRPLRNAAVAARARECGIPVVYVNRVGGQDELVFDGASFVMSAAGEVTQQWPAWHEVIGLAEIGADGPRPVRGAIDEGVEANVYAALTMAVRDYARATGFRDVLLGLSGGVDSALTLAIAVDALGRDRVHAVVMPSPYTATISLEDARTMAGLHGVRYDEMPIAAAFDALLDTVATVEGSSEPSAMEENLQARIRGALLMALSNRDGALLLTTGNKSETAVGYATLYGDMAGGFAVLKDVSKTLVYRLAAWRNALGTVIPARVLERPPSAELRPGQTDQDTLPSYDVLDAILEGYVEEGRDAAALVAAGLPAGAVREVVVRIHRSEHKRRQSAVGPRITPRAFGKDWRYPIASAWDGAGRLR